MTNAEMLEILLSVGKIKKTIRTGWVKKGVEDVESVADHSYRMAVMAILLSDKLHLNFEKLVKMALVHDVAEGVTGDIIWEKGSKLIGDHEEKTRLENNAMKEIFAKKSELYDLWVEFTQQISREAKVLKYIDKLEMVIQAGEYEQAKENSIPLDEFWENVAKYLNDSELEDFFNEIRTHFGK